ncbi:hypothetical protein BGZ57DRAFT_773945 [Hyaloscypha finlandica]|nr:hypothetical protein BGZ57DRAFT_773945 [Hyaloscypha finlandica]
MTGAYLEPGHPPPTPREIDHWNYHISLQQFAKGLQAAVKAVFPNETRSRYSCVSVLMLSWEEEDPQLPVSYEIDKLYEVFQHIYHFETEHWKIPNHNCHYRLMEKIMDFASPTDAIDHHLKIVYYAGHARLMETRSLAWTSFRNNKNSRCPIVKWSGIQTVLEEALCDVLILLDCCASGVANTCEGNGVNEVISACAYNAIANGVGAYSFTSALVIELTRLSKKTLFSVGELYRNIFIRTQSRMPEDMPEEGREAERHPAPIHLILTQDSQAARSILLSVRAQPSYGIQRALGADDGYENSQSLLSNKKSGKAADDVSEPGPFLPSQLERIPGKHVSIPRAARVPRLAFAIRLRDTFRPGEQLQHLFLDWLRNMPVIAEEVQIEAGFDSFSTLLIVSLPIAISSYLPRNDAVISLGPITSMNKIPCDGDPDITTSYLWSSVSQPPSVFDGSINESGMLSQTQATSVGSSGLELVVSRIQRLLKREPTPDAMSRVQPTLLGQSDLELADSSRLGPLNAQSGIASQ